MEQEISLREIIETLWSGKWIIVIVTALAVTFAAFYSYAIATPTYEAKGTVIINNNELPTGSLTEYVDNSTSRDVVIEVIKSPEVLQKTIDELELNCTVSSLQGGLNINKPKDNESIINISLKGSDRALSSDIILSVIENTQTVIGEDISDYISSYGEMYETKVREEQEKLNEYLTEFNSLEEANGLPLLILFQQNSGNSQYLLEANEELLQELRNLEKITQVEYEQINSRIDQTNSKIKDYTVKYEDSVSTNSINVANERIRTLSDPYAGANPISPNKILNLAIAFVLGLMISVFIVFIRAYWQGTSTER